MKKWYFIALGGFIGAIVRYGVKQSHGIAALTAYPGLHSLPLATLTVNLFGAFLIGAILTAATEYLDMPVDLRLGIVTGLLGALTTFSTLCKEIVHLFEIGLVMTALGYAAISLIGGFICVHIGVGISEWLFRHRGKAGAR